MKKIIESFIAEVGRRNTHEPEFMQAVREVAENVIPYIVTQDIYHGKNILGVGYLIFFTKSAIPSTP